MDEFLKNALCEGAAGLGISLGPAELGLFAAYHRELLIWNRKINLVSERSSERIAVRHFLDSLTPAPFLDRPDGALIDLGSGAGFPGIPLRIALPGLRATLVEASRKKSSFLSHVVRTLSLDGVRVVRERTEALTARAALADRFDMLVSRAAFRLPELLRLASFFLKPGGQLIAMKGGDLHEEMAETERILNATEMAFTALRDVRLPGVESSRILAIYNHAPR